LQKRLRKRGFLALALGIFVLFVLSAAQTPVPGQIAKIRQALNRIKPFKVTFVQQVFTDDDMDFQESGEIIFNHDRQLKWTYTDPDYKVFLLDGDQYKFYDEDNEQLMVGSVKEKNRQWIWQLLFSDSVLPYARWDADKAMLHVKNEKEALDVKIKVNAAWLPVEVTRLDPSGARMAYIFKEYRQKISISGDTFRLKVPAHVEIIHEEQHD
jgi:outer membrane lipoprotein-sorting protein